jgi:hypothetical protein
MPVQHQYPGWSSTTRAVEQLWPDHLVKTCLLFTACNELVSL